MNRSIIKSAKYFLLTFVIGISSVISPLTSSVAAQENNKRLQLDFSNNGILYYDTCGGDPSPKGTDVREGVDLEFPKNIDEDAMAKAIDDYIESNTPDSILLDTGKYIVASSKKANISPFLVVAHALVESNLGKPGISAFVDQANNSFGRSATDSQPKIPGNDRINAYMWSSGKASVDYTEPENQLENTSDFPAYLRQTYDEQIKTGNLDEYLKKYVDESLALTNYKDKFLKTINILAKASKKSNDGGRSNSGNSNGSNTNESSPQRRELGKVYIVGDSLTEGAASVYEEKMKSAGASDVRVSFSQGGNLDSPGTTGTRRSGIDSIKADSEYIKDANTVVIAHGTNNLSHTRSGDDAIKDAINAVKSSGTKAKIYWVDVAVTDKSSLGNDYVRNINKAIHGNTNAGYSVISWAKAVDATVNDDIGLIKHNSEYVGGDGVHLTPKGYEKLVDTVISALINDKEDSNTGKEVDACCDEGNAPVSTSVDITGETGAEKVFNYFISKGFTAEQAAAVAGNLMQESGGGTENLQPEVINSIGAVGIAQWLFNRKNNFMEAANRMGKPWQDIEFQIYFIGWEIGIEGDAKYGGSGPTHPHVGEELKNATSIDAAIKVWLEKYEIPCVPGSCQHEIQIRTPMANQVFEKYGDGGGSGPGGTRKNAADGTCEEKNEDKEASGDFVYYSQNDAQWMSSGLPIALAGCGPTSLAMIIATKKDKNVTPVETATYLMGVGAWSSAGLVWSGIPLIAQKYGMKSNDLGVDWEKAKSELRAGKMVLISGAGPSPFTGGGHLIVGRGVTDDGKVIIANPAPGLAAGAPENTPYNVPLPGTMNLWSFE